MAEKPFLSRITGKSQFAQSREAIFYFSQSELLYYVDFTLTFLKNHNETETTRRPDQWSFIIRFIV